MVYIFFSMFSKSKALPTNLSLHFGHAFLVIFFSHLLHVKCPLAQWRMFSFFWNVSKQTGHSGMMVDQNFLLGHSVYFNTAVTSPEILGKLIF